MGAEEGTVEDGVGGGGEGGGWNRMICFQVFPRNLWV